MEWQSTLLKHIRSTHFGLVGLAIALLVTSTILPAASIQAAYDQLQIIDTIRSRFFKNDHAGDVAKKHGFHFLYSRDRYEITPRILDVSEQIALRLSWTLDDGRTMKIGSYEWDTTRRTSGAKNHTQIFMPTASFYNAPSIQRFAESWDFLGAALTMTIDAIDLNNIVWRDFTGPRADASSSTVIAPFDPKAKRTSGTLPANTELFDVRLGILEVSEPNRTFAPRKWFVVVEVKDNRFSDELRFNEFHVPMEVHSNRGIGVQNLIVPAGELTVPAGDARVVFGDLFEVAAGLETLSIEQLLAYLRDQRDASTEQVKLIGISAPLELVAKWGVFVLLMFQVYFALHLRHMTRQRFNVETLRTYPWIALYPGLVARSVFIASVSILPITVAVVAAWPVVRDFSGNLNPSQALLVTLAVGSIALAVLTASNSAQKISAMLQVADAREEAETEPANAGTETESSTTMPAERPKPDQPDTSQA